MPNEFSNLRNLFQYMLSETFLCLYKARTIALESEMCEEQTKLALRGLKVPFEPLMLRMIHTKDCLTDAYFLGKIKNKVALGE